MSSKLWDKLTGEERENFLMRYIESEPGRYGACLAKEFSVRGANVSPHIRNLEADGKIARIPQRMRISSSRGNSVPVKRLFPATRVPSLSREELYEPLDSSACSNMWSLLNTEEKRDVFLRELEGKTRGISTDGMAKRLGVELSVVEDWARKLRAKGLVSIRKTKLMGVKGFKKIVTSTKVEGGSAGTLFANTTPGMMFAYSSENGWERIRA